MGDAEDAHAGGDDAEYVTDVHDALEYSADGNSMLNVVVECS